MIVDKEEFKRLKKEGGNILRVIHLTAIFQYGYKEIRCGSALNMYIMPNGILGDIVFSSKIYINYDSIKDIKVNNRDLIFTLLENSQEIQLVFRIQGIAPLKNVYNTIRQNANLGYKETIDNAKPISNNQPMQCNTVQPIVNKKVKSQAKNQGGMTCPKCGGHNIQIISNEANTNEQISVNINPLKPFTVFNHKKKEKVSKAKVGLGILTCGTSLLVTGTKNKKHLEVFCTECGHRWVTK